MIIKFNCHLKYKKSFLLIFGCGDLQVPTLFHSKITNSLLGCAPQANIVKEYDFGRIINCSDQSGERVSQNNKRYHIYIFKLKSFRLAEYKAIFNE